MTSQTLLQKDFNLYFVRRWNYNPHQTFTLFLTGGNIATSPRVECLKVNLHIKKGSKPNIPL